jgi:NAD(P)-dependent dehydrogenase (short-subunit alcohol dehydrogenase family)
MKVCIVGASGKLGRYLVRHALDRGYQVVGVCRERSVGKLDPFKERITLIPGQTNDREVIKRAVTGCDGVLVVLAPWGVQQYTSGTTQAVLDSARPGARLVFSCGWHITCDGQDVYSWKVKFLVTVLGGLARLARLVELDDQVEACRRVFASDRTRRVDFALFMVAALENEQLVHEAPAIVGCRTPSALAYAAGEWTPSERLATEPPPCRPPQQPIHSGTLPGTRVGATLATPRSARWRSEVPGSRRREGPQWPRVGCAT